MNEKYNFDYFVNRVENYGWKGQVIEDDKFWEDELLEDSFAVFYVYAFAHLNLPAPTVAQLEMARFISTREHNPHRMVMAMRGLA